MNRVKILNKIASPAVLLLASMPLLKIQAQTIADWTFQSEAVEVDNNPSADIGNGTASSIGMNIYPTPNVGVTTDDILAGKNSDTGNNGVADLTQEWRVRGQAGSNGAANGWSSAAPIGTQGAVFAASTVGFSGPINISFDWYATTQGEANMMLEYTTDGSTWTDVPLVLSGDDTGLLLLNNSSSANTVMGSYVSDVLNATTNPDGGQDWFTDLTATITNPNAANDPDFAIEMVNASTGADCVSTAGTALNNTSGNWRFDNVSITAAPEPSTLAFAGIFGLLAVWKLRRRG